MDFTLITPIILTFNEEPNLDKLLRSLRAFPQVLIIDSFSTDRTSDIAASYPAVTFQCRKFDNFANQWNYGLEQVKTDWVLCLDADYELPSDFLTSLQKLEPDSLLEGYLINFKYAIYGRILRCGIYPSRVIFFRKSKAQFFNDGHSQALNPQGKVETIRAPIIHDDWKDMNRWVANQLHYSRAERDKLIHCGKENLSLPDRLRLLFPLAPVAMLFYVLIWRRGLLDGWTGLFYALQRVLAELMIGLFILESRILKARRK